MRVVFFGTPYFAAAILEHLIQNGVDVVAVVTKPDKPQGRSSRLVPTAVKQVHAKCCSTIPIYQPEKASTDEFCEEMKRLSPDLFLVVSYGEIINQKLLDTPKKGCINIHPSLLPKLRGAAPIQGAILEGLSETGVSVMYLVHKMDAGDIIKQERCDLPLDVNYQELEEMLLVISKKLILEVLSEVEKSQEVRVIQDESEVTFVKKITKESSKIDFSKSALSVHNLVRALSPKPGAWCFVMVGDRKLRVKIFKTSLSLAGIEVPCSDQNIHVLELQLEGKKKMQYSDFIRGYGQVTFLK